MLLLAWIEAEIEQNTISAVRYLQGELVSQCVCVCVCVCASAHIQCLSGVLHV